MVAAKHFVFYDDVNYIKRGALIEIEFCKMVGMFLPMIQPSQNKLILESRCHVTAQWKDSFFKTLTYAYGHCPNFTVINDLISDVLQCGEFGIDHLSILSIHAVCHHLGLRFDSFRSSESFASTSELGRVERLCQITKSLNSSQYLNLLEVCKYTVNVNLLRTMFP